MTAYDEKLAAAITKAGVPLSADLVAPEAELRAEVERLRTELDAHKEHLAFLERSTLPELRRTIQHHEDGKKRWRDRAVKAEGERARFKLAWASARFRAEAHGEGILRVVKDREAYQGWLKQAEQNYQAYRVGAEGAKQLLTNRISAVLDICDREQRNAMRWENPIPVPDWVAPVQRAALGDDKRTEAAS
jgi:chromosome segregation ATPase